MYFKFLEISEKICSSCSADFSLSNEKYPCQGYKYKIMMCFRTHIPNKNVNIISSHLSSLKSLNSS